MLATVEAVVGKTLSGWERGAYGILDGLACKMRLLNLKLHLSHARIGGFKLSLQTVNLGGILAVRGSRAARWRRVGERIGSDGGAVIVDRHATAQLHLLLFIEFGHEDIQDVWLGKLGVLAGVSAGRVKRFHVTHLR